MKTAQQAKEVKNRRRAKQQGQERRRQQSKRRLQKKEAINASRQNIRMPAKTTGGDKREEPKTKTVTETIYNY